MATMTSRLIMSLVDHVTGPARNVQHAISKTRDQIERNNQQIRETQGKMLGAAGGAIAFAAALTKPVQAATEFESAMADVKKVVDFPTPEAYGEFRDELFALSREIPVSVQGLTQIAAAAGQAGIAGDDLVKFTGVAAKIGTAFDISADEAGSAMAKLMTGLGLTIDEATSLADAMNHLSNSQASSAAEILDVVRRVGAQGKQFGFNATQVSAFASAMIAAGSESDVAATSFNNMGKALTMGASAPKRLSEGLDELGLDAVAVAKRMQEDAVGTTIDVLERINALPKEMQAAISNDVFGGEARALGPLLTNLDLLRSSLGMVADENDYAGSAFKEFEARIKTFEAEMQLFRNVMSELSITLGEALIPALRDTMERMIPVIRAMTEWVSENSELIRTVLRVTASLIGLRLGLLGIKLIGLTGKGGYLWALSAGLSGVGRAGAAMRGAVGQAIALQGALAALSGAQVTRLDKVKAGLRGIAGLTGLTAAAGAVKAVAAVVAGISAPVWGAVALAAVAIGAAGAMIWKNWDGLASIVRGVASAFGDHFRVVIEDLRPVLGPVFDFLSAEFSRFIEDLKTVATDIGNFVGKVKSFFTGGLFEKNILTDGERSNIEANAKALTANILAAIDELPGKLRRAGVAAIVGLWDGMNEKLGELLEWVKGIPAKIAEAMPKIDLWGGDRPPAPLMRDPNPGPGVQERMGMGTPHVARADGGSVLPGRGYLMGERHPEFLFPSRAAYVASHQQTRALMDMARRSRVAPVARSVAAPASIPRAARATGPASINFGDIVIQGGANASADDIGRALGRHASAALRSHYSDNF